MTMQRAASEETWCARLRGDVADRLLALDVAGLAVNVRDDAVRDAVLTLTTMDPPVVAVVSMWVGQYYGDATRSALDVLAGECDRLAAYLVTESVPLPPPDHAGDRTPGLANVALLRRPADLDEATWLRRWHGDHTAVAIATQSTFGYTQNTVVRALTDGAPAVSAIVEENFPIEATTDLHAFFGAADDADLSDRMNRMLASTSAFGADRDVDTVPTSRYPLRVPFATAVAR